VVRLDGCHQRDQARHMASADLRQQIVFVLHVVVQRGFGHAAGPCHLLHRGAGIAPVGKQLRCGLQDLVALLFKAG